MTAFSITPASVATVLTDAETPATDLNTAFTGLTTAATDVYDSDGMTHTVSSALQTLFEDQQAKITGMGNRIQASMQGVYFATLEYSQGHEDMVQQVQTAAVTASQTGDFSYFEAEAHKYGLDQQGAQ